MFITHEYAIIEIGANSWHVGCITRVFQTEPRLTVVTSTDEWTAALNLIKAFFLERTGHDDFITTKSHLNDFESLSKATACSYSLK